MMPNAPAYLQGDKIGTRGEAPRRHQLPCQVQSSLYGHADVRNSLASGLGSARTRVTEIQSPFKPHA
jgi:hypothetical protein